MEDKIQVFHGEISTKWIFPCRILSTRIVQRPWGPNILLVKQTETWQEKKFFLEKKIKNDSNKDCYKIYTSLDSCKENLMFIRNVVWFWLWSWVFYARIMIYHKVLWFIIRLLIYHEGVFLIIRAFDLS